MQMGCAASFVGGAMSENGVVPPSRGGGCFQAQYSVPMAQELYDTIICQSICQLVVAAGGALPFTAQVPAPRAEWPRVRVG